MGRTVNLTGFYKGETIRIPVLAKERGGSVLTDPATATLTINIGADTDAAPTYTFDAAPQVTLQDEPTALYYILLDPVSDVPLLAEAETYRYDVYTTSAGGDKLHQAGGALVLQPASEI